VTIREYQPNRCHLAARSTIWPDSVEAALLTNHVWVTPPWAFVLSVRVIDPCEQGGTRVTGLVRQGDVSSGDLLYLAREGRAYSVGACGVID
jgi:hypothetical protein